MIVAAWIGGAMAAGLSADIENVRPVFANHGIPGVDGVVIEEPGVVRWGALAQYGLRPLVLYDKGVNIGSAVGNRGSMALGMSVSLFDRLAIRASMPVIAHWGSTAPLFTNDTVGVGDIQLGGRFAVFDTTRGRGGAARHSGFTLGLRGDLSVPSGSKDAWMGERFARGGIGLLSSVRLGPLQIAGDIGYIGRSSLDTDADLLLGGELIANVGARWDVVDRVGIVGAMYAKGGLYPPFAGAGQNVIQFGAGAQLHATSWIDVDVLLGRGITRGYGADQLRVGVGVTLRAPPKPPPVPPEVVVVKRPEDPPPPPNLELPELAPEPPPVFEWKEGELARVTGKNIEIRDPIQFEYATPNILPESLPVLAFVADLMENDPDIVHVVIEGHASEEGSYGYNYKLALSRAQAVLERLVKEGVHPDRLSFRSMGEVQPVIGGLGTIEALAPNRRVQFHITRILQPGETPVDYPRIPQYPWDGTTRPRSEDERLGGAAAAPKKAADPQPAPVVPSPENK